LKNRKVIKKPKTKNKKTPKNKIQILIDDSVVQKLISATGFGAVIWVIWILIFQGGIWFFRAVSGFSGRYLVFQGDISEGENS
jgi:hypothetical protein